MHIGAWQEYKLYKILMLRENYRKNGLYQLSTQNEEEALRKPKGRSVPGGSYASTVSNSEKTTVTDQFRGRPAVSKRGHSNISKASSKERRSIERGSQNPTAVLKQNYNQWAEYEKAKEKATKAFLEDFAPPMIPKIPYIGKPPLQRKKNPKNQGRNVHKERIEKMRALYANRGKREQEEQKNALKLPPIVANKNERFNSEYAMKQEEEAKGHKPEIIEEVKANPVVDENEVDNLIQWAQELPEEISSSLGKRI